MSKTPPPKRVTARSVLSLFLARLLGGGLHGAFQRALERVELIGRLLQQETGHELLQVGGLLIILSTTNWKKKKSKTIISMREDVMLATPTPSHSRSN